MFLVSFSKQKIEILVSKVFKISQPKIWATQSISIRENLHQVEIRPMQTIPELLTSNFLGYVSNYSISIPSIMKYSQCQGIYNLVWIESKRILTERSYQAIRQHILTSLNCMDLVEIVTFFPGGCNRKKFVYLTFQSSMRNN